MKPRLCIVTPKHWKAFMGGSQYQIKCLLDELTPLDRFDIHYLARVVPKDFEPMGYRITAIGSHARRRPIGFWHDAPSLYRTLKQLQPSVIYQRVGCAYTGIAARYAAQHGASMVWHVAHDTDVSKIPLVFGRNLVRHWMDRAALKYGVRHASRIVVQTEAQGFLLQKNYGRVADLLVRNFHPPVSETLDKSGRPTVLWVANLKRWKRPEIFVRLAQALSDLTSVQFIMVGAAPAGNGTAAWFDDLQTKIAGTGNLSYIGAQSQEHINQLMARSHVFVNTSLHEGFANTFIQAWMREVPVVSLDVDPDGVLERRRIGVLARSEPALQQSVRDLLTDQTARAEIGQMARTYAMNEHSQRNAMRLADLLEAEAVRPSRE